jgi:hypothetical protein
VPSVPQTGQLSEAYRFAPKGKGSLLSYLEHRKGLGPTELSTFVYDPSKGSLNTVALDGSIPADEVRIQVSICSLPVQHAADSQGSIANFCVDQAAHVCHVLSML